MAKPPSLLRSPRYWLMSLAQVSALLAVPIVQSFLFGSVDRSDARRLLHQLPFHYVIGRVMLWNADD